MNGEDDLPLFLCFSWATVQDLLLQIRKGVPCHWQRGKVGTVVWLDAFPALGLPGHIIEKPFYRLAPLAMSTILHIFKKNIYVYMFFKESGKTYALYLPTMN